MSAKFRYRSASVTVNTYDSKCYELADYFDWKPQIEKVNAPIQLQSIRSGYRWKYDGKLFKFCPWCGHELAEVPKDRKP